MRAVRVGASVRVGAGGAGGGAVRGGIGAVSVRAVRVVQAGAAGRCGAVSVRAVRGGAGGAGTIPATVPDRNGRLHRDYLVRSLVNPFTAGASMHANVVP